jgi:hypothetical protein
MFERIHLDIVRIGAQHARKAKPSDCVYMWAEVLDADGFDAYKQAGDLFDTAPRKNCCATSTALATACRRQTSTAIPRVRSQG